MEKMTCSKPKLFTYQEKEKKCPMVFVGACKCGHTYFPPHLFGCEACGATPESLTISEFPAKGRLVAHIAAHQHTRSDGKNPLFVGAIVLENGPAIIAGLDVNNENEIQNCETVTGKLIETGVNDKGEKIVDLFFEPAGGEK